MFRKLSFALIGFLLLTTPCFATYSEWSVGHPITADQAADIGTLVNTNNIATDRLLANYREGAAITYVSTSTLTVGAGEVMCSNIDGSVRKMRQNTSATSVGWANIDTGSQAANTTYYVYAVGDAAGGGFTILISLSATTPTGATSYKRLGSFSTDTNTYITNITNDNNYYSLSLGSWVSKSDSVVYQATTDGFVEAYITSGGQAGAIEILSDSSNPPTTVRIHCGDYDPSNGANDSPGATCPVKKGDYWETKGATTIWWIPNGS